MRTTSTLPPARHAAARPGALAQRRAQLEARWRNRLERVTALSLAYHDAAAPVAAGQTSTLDASARRARQLARQAVIERQALAEIEAALARITAGEYGWCEECGRPIESAILAAQPEVRYCPACGRMPLQGQRPGYRGETASELARQRPSVAEADPQCNTTITIPSDRP